MGRVIRPATTPDVADQPTGARYLRIDGVAQYTGLTVRHLHDLTRLCQVPHIRVGKVILYDRQAIDDWLAGRAVSEASGRGHSPPLHRYQRR